MFFLLPSEKEEKNGIDKILLEVLDSYVARVGGIWGVLGARMSIVQ